MMSEVETSMAETLMGQLQSEAARSGDARRIGTLARLVEACDEILSGEAYKRAKSAKVDPERFNPNFVKLNSQTIHQYASCVTASRRDAPNGRALSRRQFAAKKS